ncbi:myb-like protein [Arabidopsis thaliana]|uniref:Transcription factor MYB98 n=1 Tax=Arabidopsis thaliana TaxID=3702 RepID=MYB98_ARATH|nr:myb domain protein 98 [Arabidopsis thaliana]Q9S7L2.1 RecName: Full=Transcription factor MYB98; AltName: Full=Myb-related protein 98; Short=AtMYB98 [Arabidopsis thaliana]AAD53108.1 putative transcription factor [Arabidopsis thaliana]ABE66076.1 myb family transcription factor [Arabidopsis thaliana]AEE84088.1 myb domain protein 98 [Arabidopsis thaliana]CAB37462.1 myb-like protein [Arabidopsis thaliana]CAB78879.1 myb-like protein [Arabidopsis thaliana]|eukprot:NP_193612.1 myb domain protein 98 [Arabidopsis thaliana]
MENFVDENGFASLNQNIFTRDQEHMKEEDFPFEVVDQSKPTSFLQDFHHLDHDHQFDHHHHHGSSSSHPLLSVQTTSSCINNAPFEHCSYQENMVDFYETKPNLMNHHHFQAVENSYFTRNHHHHQEINLVDEHDDPMDLEQNNMMMMRMIPFDYPPTETFKPMNFVMPDEISCVSADNDCYRATSFNKTKPFLTRKLSSSSSSSSWKETKKSTLVKGQWTAEEDRVLIQLVEKYGLRKWSHIAQVLPGRIGKQCRERWHNHLRPDIKKETWSEEEDRVLIEFHKEIGNKWAEIAKRLPGRTENSIKNHWNATKRRQFSKRKCRSKYPRPSLLQDYIKSLNMGALMASSVPARGRRRESNNKKKDVVVAVEEKKKEEEVYGQDRIVPECVFTDDFGFNEKLLEEGCSIDSLLDDIPQPDIDAFVHGL